MRARSAIAAGGLTAPDRARRSGRGLRIMTRTPVTKTHRKNIGVICKWLILGLCGGL